jgi:geranylgeranyl diphosphate synthase, type II
MEPTLETYVRAVDAALAEIPLLRDAPAGAPDAPPADTPPADTPPADTPPADGEAPEPLKSAMRYSLTLPGKRLRPALLLAGYRLKADDWESAMPYAVSLEMIHAYSLVHDDLPALDNDDLRRGRPSNHRVFGENIAVLAGDGLYSLAFETMLHAALQAAYPRRAIAAMEEIARRAGVRGMLAGQTLDVKFEGRAPDAAKVAYIHRHKTADLITAAVVAGLALAGADDAARNAGETYGQNLGTAFQIVDDLLDVEGDAETMGKRTGADAKRGKMTWPALYGVASSRTDAERYAAQAADALNMFGQRADPLRELARRTLTRDK